MFFIFRMKKGITVLFVILAAVVVCVIGTLTFPVRAASAKVKDGVKVPIIMYHSLLKEKSKQNAYVISPDSFEQDLKYLKRKGYTAVVMSDLIDYVGKNKELPAKPIMLTFDDGYYNNYYYAYPLAKEYRMKIIISPVGSYTDKFTNGDCDHPDYSYCKWSELNEMMKSGYVELQNHSYDLHSSSGSRLGAKKLKSESVSAYTTLLTADLSKMQQKMKENTGYTPTAFVYPFGAISYASTPVIKSLGFKGSLSCRKEINYITKDPECLYFLGRFLRPLNRSSDAFFTSIGVD